MSDGWGPLCKFLDVPVPDVPFPNVNDSKQFVSTLQRNNAVVIFLAILLFSSSFTVAYHWNPFAGFLYFMFIAAFLRTLDSFAKRRVEK